MIGKSWLAAMPGSSGSMRRGSRVSGPVRVRLSRQRAGVFIAAERIRSPLSAGVAAGLSWPTPEAKSGLVGPLQKNRGRQQRVFAEVANVFGHVAAPFAQVANAFAQVAGPV